MRALAGAALLLTLGCEAPQHHYRTEQIKDVHGKEFSLRIDSDTGAECIVGKGENGIVRKNPGDSEPHLVPFCEDTQRREKAEEAQ